MEITLGTAVEPGRAVALRAIEAYTGGQPKYEGPQGAVNTPRPCTSRYALGCACMMVPHRAALRLPGWEGFFVANAGRQSTDQATSIADAAMAHGPDWATTGNIERRDDEESWVAACSCPQCDKPALSYCTAERNSLGYTTRTSYDFDVRCVYCGGEFQYAGERCWEDGCDVSARWWAR